MAKKAKKKVKKKRVSKKIKRLGRPPHTFTKAQIDKMKRLALSMASPM